MATVATERRGVIALITFANPPVNALAHAVREGLAREFAAANADAGVEAIVLTGSGRAFSAGADITEFKSPAKEPFLTQLIDQIEASPKPVVAALNGLALGGGLELALGCHYRVATRTVPQLGLPEVRIGIIPGAGGTQRLPRVVGVEPALEMIVSGSPVDAARAHAIGLVDHLVEANADVVAAAVTFANDLLAQGKGPARSGERVVDRAGVKAGLFDAKRRSLARHRSGPLAPKACVDAVEAAVTLPLREGLAKERELFRACAASPYARALQYAFFAERQAQSVPGIDAGVKSRRVETIGIVGAGTMGSGIALAFLSAGFPVTLIDAQKAALDRGLARISTSVENQVARGRLETKAAEAVLASLTASSRLQDVASADLVIEAVFEDMAIKKQVFGMLDASAKPGAILATNTSTLDVDEIARATTRPQDVLGLHFFSPANVMRLLEIVRAEKTGDDALATALALAKRIGKVGVVAGVCHGFIGNRMLESYLEEVQAMMLEGAGPEDIDAAMTAFGCAMGPNAMMDLAGLDVGYSIRQEQRREGTLSEERARLYRVADSIVARGRHGQKTGAGYYRYAPDPRTPTPDSEIGALYRDEAARLGLVQRQISADEITERCLLRLVNTGARILEEGIALRASDIDVIYLNGYGFPAWRGGPMWTSQHAIGLPGVVEKSRAYLALHGDRWTPAPLIERLANEGKGFAAN